MLEFIGISKSFGSQAILKDVSFRIGDDDHVGLVGANGSGKTTIFRLIVGDESPDEGGIQKKKGIRVGFLPQEIDVRKEGTILSEALDALPEYASLLRERQELEALSLVDHTDGLMHRKLEVERRFEELGGENVRARACGILTGLGFPPAELDRPLSEVSGGWHMRVRLARLLLADPDLLLLDEPTNHLDLPSIVWFEQYLKGFRGAYVIVSHDREFLNRTITRCMEVDHAALSIFTGNWDVYRRRKTEEYEHREKAYWTQQARIREIEEFIARNRVRKDRAAQVQSRLKMLEKMEKLELPEGSRQIRFHFPQPVRPGSMVLKTDRLRKAYGDRVVFDGVDFSLARGEKVALIGINGMGKSTLLKIAAGALPFEGGERVLGPNVSVGYYAQHALEALVPHRTVLDELLVLARDESLSQLRSLLGAFLFSGSDVEKKVAVLSGGEKSRLALAKLLLRPANFLVMDEPTNHLDIRSREVLEEALKQYDGTLLLASHDRRFIDALCTRVVEVRDGRLLSYPGNYSYFEWKRQEESAAAPAAAAADRARGPELEEKKARRDDRKEKRRQEAELRNELYRTVAPLRRTVEALEAAVAGMEEKIRKLEWELADPALWANAADRARDKAMALAELRADLDEKMEGWETALRKCEEAEADVRSRFTAEQEQ